MTEHPTRGRLIWHGCEREANDEGAALARCALDGQRATVLFDDMPGIGQPNAGALDSTNHVAAAPKRLEDVRQVARGNTDALIANDNLCPVGARRHLESNVAAGGAVADRVGDQVVERALQA